ncbi:MAG: hypothetical protein JSS82_14040 [Bacteroidetes bacterium]|nr:hypothetical protein [Bacteroidota bacterium]
MNAELHTKDMEKNTTNTSKHTNITDVTSGLMSINMNGQIKKKNAKTTASFRDHSTRGPNIWRAESPETKNDGYEIISSIFSDSTIVCGV